MRFSIFILASLIAVTAHVATLNAQEADTNDRIEAIALLEFPDCDKTAGSTFCTDPAVAGARQQLIETAAQVISTLPKPRQRMAVAPVNFSSLWNRIGLCRDAPCVIALISEAEDLWEQVTVAEAKPKQVRASFDCGRQLTRAETVICSDAIRGLSSYERKATNLEKRAVEAAQGTPFEAEIDPVAWRNDVMEVCGPNPKCLFDVLVQRSKFLSDWNRDIAKRIREHNFTQKADTSSTNQASLAPATNNRDAATPVSMHDGQADFVGPGNEFRKMAIEIWRGRFDEAFNAYGVDADLAPRQRLRGDILFTAYHPVYADLCDVPSDSPVVQFDFNEQTSENVRVRSAYARQVVTVANRTTMNNFTMLLGVGPDFVRQLIQAGVASKQVIERNGCSSPATRQFEENLSRAVMGGRSLQAEGFAPDALSLACLQSDIGGLNPYFSEPLAQSCECLNTALESVGFDRLYLAALEDQFSRDRLLGVLASDLKLWNKARSCAQNQTHAGVLSLESSQEAIFAELERVGCAGSAQDFEEGLKSKNAVRCLQRFGGTPRTGELTEADIFILAEIPDGAAISSANAPSSTVELPSLPHYLSGWRFNRQNGVGDTVVPLAAQETDMPGVTLSVSEVPVEFPDLGIRVKESWNYNQASLEILAIQEFGPVWLYAYDKIAPGMRIDGHIQAIDFSIRQARRTNDRFGFGEGGVSLSVQGNLVTVPIGCPRLGAWQEVPSTAIEIGSRRPKLAELRIEHIAFETNVEKWIESGGCAISDEQLETLDGALTASAIFTGNLAREGDLLFHFQTSRDRACNAPTASIALSHFIRFHTIMDRDCAFESQAGKQSIIERAINFPPTPDEFRLATLTRMTNGGLSQAEAECIGSALERDFSKFN